MFCEVIHKPIIFQIVKDSGCAPCSPLVWCLGMNDTRGQRISCKNKLWSLISHLYDKAQNLFSTQNEAMYLSLLGRVLRLLYWSEFLNNFTGQMALTTVLVRVLRLLFWAEYLDYFTGKSA